MFPNEAVSRLDVVLPTHNVGPWLADALESLQRQTLTGWRAYIVLDTCTDESESIARDFAVRDARFTVVVAEETGVGRARNLGFVLGRSPYVAFIDPDDLVPTGAFATLTGSLEHSGSDLATGHAVQFRDPSNEWPYWTMGSGLFAAAAESTSVAEEPRLVLDHTTWNKVYRRDFLAEHGIRFPEDVAIGEDAHHTLEAICSAQAIDVVPATVYRHRVRPDSLTSVIRNTASVTEWVAMTRGIEAIVTGAGIPAVTEVWLRRMLENEAWTRARQVGGMEPEESLDEVLALFRDLIAAVPSAHWETFPLTIRWAYDVLGVTSPPRAGGKETLEAELAFAAEELAGATGLPEFERFANDLRQSGTQLRAHVWRESLLMPFLRVTDRLDVAQRRRALARLLVFHDRFVACHALLPGEAQLVFLARSELYDALARWSFEHRSIRATAETHRATPGRLSITATVRHPHPPAGTAPDALVAVSLGRIAGVTLTLGTLTPTTDHTATGTINVRAIRPFGRWTVGILSGGAGEPAHFIPLRLVSASPTRLRPALRNIVRASAVDGPLILESKPSVPRRALAKVVRHRLVSVGLRRVTATVSRFGRPKRQL